MSQVIKDLEEALKREISSLSTHHKVTKTNTSMQTTYDPLSGEAIETPLEPSFYDENSGANAVTYPRVDITFDKIQEDRDSGRMISIWEDRLTSYRILIKPNQDRPQVFEQVTSGTDGVNVGNGLQISSLKLNKISTSNLIKIVSGTNKGTYSIQSLDLLNKTIVLEPELVSNIQELSYNASTRKLTLLNPTDLFVVRGGDLFEDSLGTQFPIIEVNTKKREIYLGGQGVPDLGIGSKVIRIGDVLRNVDSDPVYYIVMDKDKPLLSSQYPHNPLTDSYLTSHPATPFNYYYTIEIKNKNRNAHIETADRMTETVVNRPRRAIEVLLRCPDSAESNIKCGPSNGDGRTVEVESVEHFCINDSVYLANRFRISENNQIIDIDEANNLLILRNNIPNEFGENNNTVIVSNADLKTWSFYLNEGSVIVSQDSVNNFFRQEYSIRIEGWKSEKTGDHEEGAITKISGTIETPSNIVEEF